MVKILKTDNGPHSAEKWAVASAETIFDVSTVTDDTRLIQAKELQTAIAKLLVPHHAKVQFHEKTNLRANAEHMRKPLNVEGYLQNIIDGIVVAAKDTPWQIHFSSPAVQDAIKDMVAQHLIAAQHIERLWHADHNPDCTISQAYKKKHVHGEGHHHEHHG